MSVIHPIFEEAPKRADWRKTVINTVILVYVTVNALLTVSVLSDWKAYLFLIRRPDMVHATMKVESEEKRIIEIRIAESRKETIKKILSPIIVESLDK